MRRIWIAMGVWALLAWAGGGVAARTLSVCEFRSGGAMEGDFVEVEGVTLVDWGLFGPLTAIADPAGGPWCGISPLDPAQVLSSLRQGDCVRLRGVVFQGELAVSGPPCAQADCGFEVFTAGCPGEPPPSGLASGEFGGVAPQYEYTLVRLDCLQVSSVDPETCVVGVDDGSGEARVRMLPGVDCPAVGDELCAVVGVCLVGTQGYEIRPRDTGNEEVDIDRTPLDDCVHCLPPTPTPPPASGAFLDLNQELFHAGDPFLLRVQLGNAGSDPEILDLYIVLDVWGSYWFWDTWTQIPGGKQRAVAPGLSDWETILSFTWPPGAGQGQGIRFWAALLDPVTMALFGEYSSVTFDFD
jgi:hypothetical protein